jgi:hypothetical protein
VSSRMAPSLAPCGRGAHGVIVAKRPPGAPTIPLSFSAEELDLLLELSRPIEPAQRSAFLDAVAAAIGGRQAGRASSTRWAGGSRGNFGRRRSCPTPRPCTAAAPPPKGRSSRGFYSMGDGSLIPISDEQAIARAELVKAVRDGFGYFTDILGDLPKDLIGYLIGDRVKAKRIERLAALWQRTREHLRDRGVDPEPPSLKYAIPILEAAADEENEELQDLWSRLLAAAMDPNRRDAIRQSFIQTVKQIDPMDALVLKAIRDTGPEAYTTAHELERQLKCSMDEVMVSIDHLAELGCVALNYQNPQMKPFGTLLMNVVSG